MDNKFLDKAGLQTVWNKIKGRYDSPLKKLNDKVFPWTFGLSPSGTGYAKKGTTRDVTLAFSAKDADGKAVGATYTVSVNGGAAEAAASPKTYAKVGANTTYQVNAAYDGGTKGASYTLKFVNPKYLQIVAADFSPTAANVAAAGELTDSLNESRGYTRDGITLANQKVMYAYPKAFGDLTSIKDANGFDGLGGFTKSVIAINGEDYNVYVQNVAATQTGVKQVFA